MTEGWRSRDNGWKADDQWAQSLMKKNRRESGHTNEAQPGERGRKRWQQSRGREREELHREEERGRRREARIPGGMERLQIRESTKKERKKDRGRTEEADLPGCCQWHPSHAASTTPPTHTNTHTPVVEAHAVLPLRLTNSKNNKGEDFQADWAADCLLLESDLPTGLGLR
ncbi:hypothetical protein FQA47_003381 [Oryzias melastigma]|uniref:Uncharacterized protein n=1 Tax=Oryzias melastigma TaxID=30732 RepID=A0A834FQG3_ORYME|nr:hypothetical protein FQA47_003381 [Oryzias melastigma]